MWQEEPPRFGTQVRGAWRPFAAVRPHEEGRREEMGQARARLRGCEPPAGGFPRGGSGAGTPIPLLLASLARAGQSLSQSHVAVVPVPISATCSFSGPVQPAEGLLGGGARLQEAGAGPGSPGRTEWGGHCGFSDATSEAACSFGVDSALGSSARCVGPRHPCPRCEGLTVHINRRFFRIARDFQSQRVSLMVSLDVLVQRC